LKEVVEMLNDVVWLEVILLVGSSDCEIELLLHKSYDIR